MPNNSSKSDSEKLLAKYKRIEKEQLKATERIKTEEKMRLQKYFLEKIQDIGKIGTWQLDLVRNTLVWTDENYKIFGVPKGTDLTYELFLDFVHPDDLEYVKNAWKAALSGEPYDIEHRINVDGSIKWVREKAMLEFDAKGKCIRGIGVTQDITQHKQKEKIQSVKLRLVDYASSHNSRELLQKFLDEAESLAESEIGFYHLIDDDQKTLSLQAWSTNTLKNMRAEDMKKEHYPIEKAGVWGDSFKKQTSIVYNDYQALSHKAELPKWHAPVFRLLTVPVIRGKTVVAILGVGNKRTDYTSQDVEMINEVADLSWEAISLKKSNETLKDSEERFKFLSEATVEGIYIHDNGVVLDANESLAKKLGYDSANELIGSQIMTKHVAPESLKKAQTYIASGYQGAYEIVVIKCDGTRFPVELIARNIEYKGKPARVAAARDITEHKAAEKKLTWNVRRNEILSETAARLLQSGNPTSLINDLGKTVMAFLDCQVFFNFLEDTDTGKLHLNACAGIPDEKRSQIEWIDHGTTVCAMVDQTGQRMICEDISDSSGPLTTLIKSLGIQVYCCHPLILEERLLGTLSFGKRSDSTFLPEEIEMMESVANLVAVAVNRIKTEKEKINLEAQLRQAQKVEAIGRLAGGVAHDLNNMLCPILNYAEMLTEDLSVGDERREQALEIANAGSRARDLVRQLLAFSRKQVITLKPIDINQVVRGIEKLLLRTIPEDIKLKKNLSREIRPVLADIGQIEQILINLTVNSADAMPDGGLLIIETGLSHLDEEYARTHPDVRPGLYVMLSVSDTGSGMDDATLAHIFEPFFSTKGERGTGLGLATVYGIVKQHRGNIWVYSEPEMGTTFKIYLPPAMEMPDKPDKEESVKKTKNSLKGEETILLVEDNEQVRNLGRAILKRWGYKVLEAENGDDALDIMASYGDVIHLLLTDVVMPGMNGKELYDKAVQKYQDLKVLFMSGYTDDIIADRGVLSEGIQLLQKPFSVNGLASKVREVLDNNGAGQNKNG
ncbi:GAF domain-containing protein [Desulfobacter curvatus]|uniref:GAF domain-containing protein n=1 Tax=Desulfobacter curvatus TaxID=2290 RepID=UPI00036AB811|nr:GAF domain-containing protein [Desulfobacter curvatus]